MLLLEDQHEHLGQSIAYARSNGVVPPWSGRSAAVIWLPPMRQRSFASNATWQQAGRTPSRKRRIGPYERNLD